MASSSSDVALLTEHFGYPPVTLLDEIINIMNDLADRALTKVEENLLKQPPATIGFKPSNTAPSKPPRKNNNAPTTTATDDDQTSALSPEEACRHEIENGTHQLETLLCSSIDRNFDKFELYVMQNILCVRPSEPMEWIRLGHYEGLDFDESASIVKSDSGKGDGEGDEQGEGEGLRKPSVEGVRRLRRRLQASQQLNAMLHAEKARNEALLGQLRAVVGIPGEENKAKEGEMKMEVDDGVDLSAGAKAPFAFLHDAGGLADGAKDKPIETTTAFSLSQLQALRALSTSLRTIMPDLAGTGAEGEEEDDGGRKSWRRERMEYVETSTRTHLENARGLELGKDGEVRDGEWQDEGRKLAKDEVEGLEKVVALLGEAGRSNADEMDES